MKTILSFLTCLFALAIIGRAETGVVKVDKLNIRAQAKGNAEAITQLVKGDRVTIVEKKAVAGDKKSMTWLKIALPDKATVWIKSEFLKDSAVTAEKVNVRSGAGVNFSIVGLAHRGDKVQSVRTLADWTEVRAFSGCYGWVSSEYVDITPEVQAAPPAETIQPIVPAVGSEPAKPAAATTTSPQPPAKRTVSATATAITTVNVVPPKAVTDVEAGKTNPPTQEVVAIKSDDVASSAKPVTRDGVVHTCAGYVLKRQGTHALWVEGVPKPYIIAYLNSPNISLDQYEGRKVQIIGNETTLMSWKNPVIEVQQVQPMWQ